MAPRQVVGTDVFHAAILLWAAGLAHVAGGNVDWGIVGSILIGSIPGVWIGSHLTARMPTAVLRTALGIVMITSSLALFEKAGVDLPTAVVIAIPSALLLGVILKRLSRRIRPLPPPPQADGKAA
jgi:uncharacterized membrane protein YfcA